MDKTRIIHFVQKAGGHFYTEMLASKPAQKREGVSFTIEQLLEFAEMIAKHKALNSSSGCSCGQQQTE